jgi:very-short-patch-repair endonuclease
MNLKSFNRGQRCPKCKSSRGECTIRYILHSTIGKENIKEQYPITIKGKKHIFDFCIPSNPNIYIEYDGEQHFNKDNRWYSEDREKRDTEKNNFVHEEGAILIRIPYYLSKEEVYKSLTTNLTPHLKIKKTEIDLSRAEYYNGFSFSVNDVAEYYITHNCRSTANKFNIYELTVRNYFKEVFGMTKTDYINKKYDTDYSPAKIGILPQFNQQ